MKKPREKGRYCLGVGRRMTKAFRCFLVVAGFSLLIALSIAEATGKTEVSAEQEGCNDSCQQVKGMALFAEILALGPDDAPADRMSRKESLYRAIIAQCPHIPLAEESYLHLTDLLLRDSSPPRSREAVALLGIFLQRYPDSPLGQTLQVSIERRLFEIGEWALLRELDEKFAASAAGGGQSPLSIFFYAEARFKLADLQGAVAGYKALIDCCPESKIAIIAHRRLERIGSAGGGVVPGNGTEQVPLRQQSVRD